MRLLREVVSGAPVSASLREALAIACWAALGCASPDETSPPSPPSAAVRVVPASAALVGAESANARAAPSSAASVDPGPEQAPQTSEPEEGMEEELGALRVGPPAKRRSPRFATGACQVPGRLTRVPRASWSAALRRDPLESGAIQFRDPDEGSLPPDFPFERVNAGGPGDEVDVSEDGRFVRVRGMRGGVALQRASGELVLHTFVSDIALAPDGTYALILPTRTFKGTTSLLAKVPLTYRGAPSKVLDVGPKVDIPDVEVDICATGRIYAVTSGATGLSVRDAITDDVAASAPNAPAGVPRFSRSGRLLAVRDGDEIVALYRLERASTAPLRHGAPSGDAR